MLAPEIERGNVLRLQLSAETVAVVRRRYRAWAPAALARVTSRVRGAVRVDGEG